MRELLYMPRILGELLYPGGLPLYYMNQYWVGNVKEDLVQAVQAYFKFKTGSNIPLTEDQLELLLEFLVYFINAPIWGMNPHGTKQLDKLKTQADAMKTVDDISTFIFDCLEIGLDPL